MSYRQIVTLDFETYFDSKYSLKSTKYNTSEYVRDPQFKAHCLAIKIGDSPVTYHGTADIPAVLNSIKWSISALLAHNTAFDGFILSHHFGIVPAYYLDTLSMARAVHSNNIRNNLDTVASYYGIGNKLPDVLGQTRGVRDLSPELLTKLMQYCAVDVELCYQIYKVLLPNFQRSELDLIDLTLQMFCNPILHVDVPRAKKALESELAERDRKIADSGVPITVLRSNEQFAEALKAAGVTALPMKTSPRTGEETFAFAKADLDFQNLLGEDSTPEVRKLVEARMAARSTINETRAIRFIHAGESGKLPVMLNYFGAHTSRWSAGNRMNMQNLKRGGELRKCVIAPPGFKIVSCDSAQIEARVLAWLAEHDLNLAAFRTGQDVYKLQAAAIYGGKLDDITPDQRFVGKVCTLGLGYGMGGRKFQYTLAAGLMGPPVYLSNDACGDIVARWRIFNLNIPKLWDKMNGVLTHMVMNFAGEYKCLTWQKDEIHLPNGIVLRYPNLEGDYSQEYGAYSNFRYYNLQEKTQKRFGIETPGKKIYGGLLTENVVQALARIIVADQMLEISKRYRVVTMTHDEVVCVVPDCAVQEAERYMVEVMRTPPKWGEDIPLNAEVESGQTYG